MLKALTRAVDELADVDPPAMCDAEMRETYLVLRREIDRSEACAARLLAGIDGRGIPSGDGASSTAAWVQAHTGQRYTEAHASLATGRACEALPVTAKAWAEGNISASAARMICRGVRDGHEDIYAAVEETLVEFAARHDFRSVEGLIRHYQTRVDALDGIEPSDLNGTHLSRVGNRWSLTSDLDGVDGAIHDAALNAAMDQPGEDDTRSPAKRRAHASTRIHRFFLDHAELPVEGGEVPHLNIIIGWETIRAGAEALLATRPSDTALSPTDIERLLCEANISRVVLGPDSIPLDVGRATRTPSKALRRAVMIRDGGCRFPGCDRKPSWCEVHHHDPWHAGGETKLETLLAGCDYHHHLIHKPGWRATFDGRTFTVVNPEGRIIGSTTR
jgi:hypothetical protein